MRPRLYNQRVPSRLENTLDYFQRDSAFSDSFWSNNRNLASYFEVKSHFPPKTEH